MPHDRLRAALATTAADAVPDGVDLWPAIEAEVAARAQSTQRPVSPRRAGLLAAVAGALVVGFILVQPSIFGQSATAQAADIARNDPEVAAILRGDISIVTVTSVVGDVATVSVGDSRGNDVTVTVDLRSRVATVVYQGPQLSAVLTAQATAILHSDPRTASLLARGATMGRITPIAVTVELAAPTPGTPVTISETWAQVPLVLTGQEWLAYVDLPQSRLDRLIDPNGSDVPLP